MRTVRRRQARRPRRRDHAGRRLRTPDEARTVARRLVDSNLVGHDSHGVLRVGKYLEWVRDGWLKPNTPPTIVFDSDTIAIVDGNRGFGQVIGEFATSSASRRRRKTGIAMVGLRNCGHLGRLGDWAEMAAEAGQVSLHFLNTSGAQRVAPFGGSDRRLSTNPLAIGVPVAGGRSGHPRHHDVDGRRRQADGRAEQGRAGAGRLDRRQARQADDRPEGFLRRRRAADHRRAQGLGPVDPHRPARRRGHDGHAAPIPTTRSCATTCCRSSSRPRSTTADGGVLARGEAIRRLGEGVAAATPGEPVLGPGDVERRRRAPRGSRAACRSTTRRGTI